MKRFRTAILLCTAVVAAMFLIVSQAAAADIISLFNVGPNQASDENREYLIDRVGDVPGQIDVGDSLRGIIGINTLNSTSGNVGGETGNNEWTGVFQVKVLTKEDLGGGFFLFTFEPDPDFENDLSGGIGASIGFAPGPGAMIVMFEDPSNNFAADFDDPAPATPPAGPDDGTPAQTVNPPSSADVSTGPYATEEAFIALARDGGHFWTLGFAGAPGEGWVATTSSGDNVLVNFAITSGSSSGFFNAGLTRLSNNSGIGDTVFVAPVTASAFGGTVEFAVSGQIRGVYDLDTPFETSSNVNLSFTVTEVSCSIGDFVWEDANRNGCQDPEERPIEGVEVALFEDCASPTEIASTTTNGEGFYEFTNLDCDKEYRVQFGDAGAIYRRTLPFQDCSSTDPPEPSEANDSDCGQDDGFSGCVTFPDPVNAPDNPTIDCGYVCEGKIGDYVWLDENEDGCQDEVDTGIGGVDVTLSEDCVDRENPKTVQTDPDGFYLFDGLCPGAYFVEFGNGRPSTNPGQMCDNDPDVSGEKDSNCGDEVLQCVQLTRDNPEDPTIDCGKVGPCLELEKLVSGDGGVSFFDADNCSDADVPFTVNDAEYKLIVTNCGREAVTLDTIVDNDLGINLTLNPTVTIQPGDSVEFTNDAGQTAGLLQKVGACPNPDNQFENTATVSGTGAGSGDLVEATDPACVKCGPCIDLLKEVSVDGGVNWFDANSPDCSDGPGTSDPAEYRLTITNCGGEELVNVVINDDVLGINNFPAGQTIPVDGSITLTKDDIVALGKEDLCPLTPGDPGVTDNILRNIARVDAAGETSGIPVSDEDPACVKCEEEEGCLTLTPGFWCTHDRVTELFLPVDSCGITLDNIDAATSASAIEDLDFSGRDFKANDTSPQQLQLIRQCTAAALNFAASAEAGGSCSDIVLSDGRTIDVVFAACCEDLCTSGASGPTISESNCIERLDEFNNLEPDTLTCESDPPAPFPFCPSLGANGFNATPATCQEANGNGFVNPGRNLGPR